MPSKRASIRERATGQSGVGQKTVEIRSVIDEYGLDQICRDIQGGMMLSQVCEAIGPPVNIFNLTTWLNVDKNRATKVRDARSLAAVVYEEMAFTALTEAKNDFKLAKAKELASHLRWRAARTNPRDYGDKSQLDISDTRAPMTQSQVDEKLAALLKKAREKRA